MLLVQVVWLMLVLGSVLAFFVVLDSDADAGTGTDIGAGAVAGSGGVGIGTELGRVLLLQLNPQ